MNVSYINCINTYNVNKGSTSFELQYKIRRFSLSSGSNEEIVKLSKINGLIVFKNKMGVYFRFPTTNL